jgi:hypothetical protein
MAEATQGDAGLDHNKQLLLDYFRDHLAEAHSSDELAQASGLSPEATEIAAEALAYEQEITKEYDEGGKKFYRRKP